jgi:periplasmic copper chaperone A
MRFAAAAFALVTLAAPAFAHAYEKAGLTIGHPYANDTIPGQSNGAVFLTLENKGDADDRLVGAATPRAGVTEIHTHTMDDGVMRMRKIDGVDVPAGTPVAFAPGGLHFMLIGLTAPLKEGETFPLTLTFEKAGAVEVMVLVEKRGSHKDGGGHAH